MSALGDLSDEYVAKMLKKDAEASSIKYSALGLEAFLPKRPNGAAPKPNTRFLRTIIRETDTHNAALLAKEQREAKTRQNALTSLEDLKRSASPEADRPKRRRSYDRQGSGRKRRHMEDSDERRKTRRTRTKLSQRELDEIESTERHWRPGMSTRRSRSRSKSPRKSHRDSHWKDRESSRRKREIGSDGSDNSSWISRHRSSKHRRRSHSREHDLRHARRCRDGYRSSAGHRSRGSSSSHSPAPSRRRKHRGYSTSPNQTQTQYVEMTRRPAVLKPVSSNGWIEMSGRSPISNAERRYSPSDSDPLEAIVGPAPPPPEPEVRTRGRGAFTQTSSAMDSHFASQYDPSVDVQPDPETEDDWDQALEALRDRQKWKQQGAERLRSAGFSELEVKKWEKGGNKDENDVKWASKGEGREWDRGKVIDTDGSVDLKAEWGRLR